MRFLGSRGSQVPFWLGTAAVMLLCSCYVSADHSFLDPAKCYVDDAMLGVWQSPDDDPAKPARAAYEFRRGADGRSIDIVLLQSNIEDDSGEMQKQIESGAPMFRGWVAREKGEELFCLQQQFEPSKTEFLLLRMSRPDRAIIVLQELDQRWVDEQLTKRKLKLSAERLGGIESDTRISASTDQLQPLLVRAVRNKKQAFSSNRIYLFRVSAPGKASEVQTAPRR